jgi:hypothetical protein
MQTDGIYRRNLSFGRAPSTSVRIGLSLLSLLAISGFNSTPAGSNEPPLSVKGFSTDRGIVIVDGQFICPPYQFEVADRDLSVNGIRLSIDDYDLTFFQPEKPIERSSPRRWESAEGNVEQVAYLAKERSSMHRRTEPWGRRADTIRRARRNPGGDLFDELVSTIYTTANCHGVTVLAKGQTPLFLDRTRCGHELLVALLSKSTPSPSPGVILAPPDAMGHELERRAWNQVIADFEPSPAFAASARSSVQEVTALHDAGEKIVKATLWADSISYPLTLFAMIVVVVAFGHLLSNKPCIESVDCPAAVSPETRKIVLKSLLIFALLSLVDLIWTLVAGATGSMRELNPIGNEIIHDPTRLIAFKLTAVSVTVALLYSLHHRPIAQVASWWSCLVLTLLTARWLTFNSMFM